MVIFWPSIIICRIVEHAMSLPVQVVSHIIINNIGPIILSMMSSVYSLYTAPSTPITSIKEVDEERELDLLQMERLIKWMNMLFDYSVTVSVSQKAYKQELYNIYVTIVSDYKQYQQWKAYNDSLWIMTAYRKKNTKALAKKILGDCTLFKEGLQMFSMMH